MFLTLNRSGYLGTGQYASGLFLMLFTNENAPRLPNGKRELRALVRKVALRQVGHFMMGHVTLVGECFSLSGTYGADGLPIEVTKYQRLNEPPKPASFEDTGQYLAYYDALLRGKWGNVERVPGLWERLHVVPVDLCYEFWSASGGHNSSGSEGPTIHQWALDNIETMRHLRKVGK